MNTLKLLSLLIRIPPEAWDWIVPHGPSVGRIARGDKVAFNPQPDPPGAFVIGAAELGREIARIAVATEATGESAESFVSEIIDDWCGTGWPRRFPFPFPFPPDPDPEPDWRVAGQLAGAVALASVAARITEGKLGAVLNDGAERLAETALRG